MINIIIPNKIETINIQGNENRHYYSRLIEIIIKREGIISVTTSDKDSSHDKNHIKIFTRGQNPNFDQENKMILEGPIEKRTLDSLGLSATYFETDSLSVRSPPPSVYAVFTGHDARYGRKPDFFPHPPPTPDLQRWSPSPVPVQFLSGEGWTPLLTAQDTQTGAEGAVAIRKGNRLLFGFPIFDLLCHGLTFPPLTARYDGFSRLMNNGVAGRIAVRFLMDAIRADENRIVRIKRWPEDYRSALTVRHDYDREVPLKKIEKLLLFYNKNGIKSSIGFLSYLLDKNTINKFEDYGHEIQAHVSAHTESDFIDHMSKLNEVIKNKACGTTIHGGHTGIGYRGQTHLEWFERNKLEYSEIIGVADSVPFPACLVSDDGIPRTSNLIVTPKHISLDKTTKEEDHYMEQVISKIPSIFNDGNYAMIMNHPDIHQNELINVFDNIKISNVWNATSSDVCKWFRLTHYTPTVDIQPDKVFLSFVDDLTHNTSVRINDKEYYLKKENDIFGLKNDQ